MMTPHICSAHVLFKALQASKTGLLFLKVVRKCKLYQWGKRYRIFKSHSFVGNQLEPQDWTLNSTKNIFLLKQALKWPEESSADRNAMTSVYQKSWFLTKPSYGTELQTQCSIQGLAWLSQPASGSVEAVLISSPCCRREQDFQVVSHRIINHCKDFTHNPHCVVTYGCFAASVSKSGTL